MKKITTFILCLAMGLNVFAQQKALKAVPCADVKNFKVAETQFNHKSPTRETRSSDYIDCEAMVTTYDLQSNSVVANRMYQSKNGSVAVVATMSRSEYDAEFLDRGTGYNFFSKGNALSSYDIPKNRIEAHATGDDIRTGWPTIAPYGKEGEILVNHGHASGLAYYIREKAGEGLWDGPHAIPNPENIDEVVKGQGNTLSWARIVTTGENNDVLHVFANAAGDANTASYYLRTEDLETWDIQFAPVVMDNLHINCYAADDYSVSVNGDKIAVLYCAGFSQHVMLYESEDAGLTWESRMVWECPIDLDAWYDDNGNYTLDELYGPTQGSVAIGADGVSHVVLGASLYGIRPGGYYTLYYGQTYDGVAYWNSTYETPLRSPQDNDLRNALRLWWTDPEDTTMMVIDHTNFCAMTPMHTEQGFNGFDYKMLYTGNSDVAGDYLMAFGLCAYPSIAVDPAGNLAVAFSAPDVNRDELYGNRYYYRSIFVNYKPANVNSWTETNLIDPTNLYSASAHSNDECTFVTAVSTPINENEFWFSCLSDDTPGFYSGSTTSQNNITTGTINVFKFNPVGSIDDEPVNPGEQYPEQPEQIETTSIYRVSQVYSEDGFEVWDYNYSDETGTNMVSIDKLELFEANPSEFIDSLSYDNRGNITKVSTWRKFEGEWINECYVEYTYNDQNLRVTRKNYNNFDTWVLGGTQTFVYDDQGRMTSWTMAFNGLDEYQKTFIEYNEDGLKETETMMQYNYSTYLLEDAFMIEYKYNANGNLNREDEYTWGNGTWSLQLAREYEYDEYGNCIMEEVRTASGRVQERSIYTYDTSIPIENVYHYVNPERDYPILPQMKSMLKSFEYYAENDNGELVYVTDFIFKYELTEINVINNFIVKAESSSSIKLSWSKVTNTESYDIYRDGKYLTNVITTTYTDKNLSENTEYCYEIIANCKGGKSVSSRINCAKTMNNDDTPTPDEPLDTPENLKAEALSISSISLSWNKVEEAKSYNIYRDEEFLTNVGTTTYTDNNLKENTTYCYTVTAVRGDEESEESDEDCATTFSINTEIETPANLEAKALNASSISLSWDEVEDADSYNIYRDGKLLKNNAKNSYTDKNLKENEEYCYTVSAIIDDEESEQSEEACAKTLKLVLNAPDNFEAKAKSSSSILLTWDEETNAESYNIYQDDEFIDETDETEYLVEDLDADTKYCFYVTAVNGSKESNESDEDCDRTYDEDEDEESLGELSSSFEIYPNPVENELFLATEVRVEEIAIYDIYGRHQTTVYGLQTTDFVHSVNVANLEAGVYFVKIKTDEGNIVKRFVKN